jgi:geranylgeranyl diphosphate synthase type II
MDNDDLRRGELANHKIFGEGISLLAGDALLTQAFHLVSRPQLVRALKPSLILDLIHEIARAAGVGGMVGGQAVDLEEESREVNIATVENIHLRKTGALILASARVGARIGGASPGELKKISRYGESLGLAFQIADDVLDAQDCKGNASRKESGNKERKKATYPSIAGLAAAKARVQELLQHCLKEIEHFGKNADPLRGIARYVVWRIQ